MFIEYSEYELLELFQSEPISITGNLDDGELMYMYEDDRNFKLIFILDVYKQTVSLSITFKDLIVFKGEFSNVTSMKKDDGILIVYTAGKENFKVILFNQIGVELL
ncbi:hypothetical protein QU593_02415 [Rossellomorea marisflavi]|uniref:hypothetical protein n=1 Tax=Rossellomorea marisflavi TaxID=189381 RepID=UPI0025B0579E|nr:hypothetical protein [Rossellomorea marisflavi]WJV19381.1 hypothetical protein QU593_02415 [Rossellomorea marisflavi]